MRLENFFRVPPPWSNVVAVIATSLVAGYVIWDSHSAHPAEEFAMGQFIGIGMILGGVLSLTFKAAAEVDDRLVWRKIVGVFRRSPQND